MVSALSQFIGSLADVVDVMAHAGPPVSPARSVRDLLTNEHTLDRQDFVWTGLGRSSIDVFGQAGTARVFRAARLDEALGIDPAMQRPTS